MRPARLISRAFQVIGGRALYKMAVTSIPPANDPHDKGGFPKPRTPTVHSVPPEIQRLILRPVARMVTLGGRIDDPRGSWPQLFVTRGSQSG